MKGNFLKFLVIQYNFTRVYRRQICSIYLDFTLQFRAEMFEKINENDKEKEREQTRVKALLSVLKYSGNLKRYTKYREVIHTDNLDGGCQ